MKTFERGDKMKKTLTNLLFIGLASFSLTTTLAQVQAQDDTTEEEVTTEVTQDENDEAKSDAQTAMEVAIEIFKEEFPDAEIDQVDVELKNDGFYEIDIDGFNENQDFELTVHSENNEISEREEDEDNDQETALDFEALLSLDEASEIALAEVDLEIITQWTLDSDDGRFEWEVEFDEDENDGREATVKIDAESGEVIDVDLDD